MKTPELKCCGKKVTLELIEDECSEASYEGTCKVCEATYSVLKGMEV